MKADTSQFPQLDKTKFEQRGKEFEFGIPITNSVCLGNSIAVGFGDGTVRIFRSGKNSKTIKAHNGVVLCMAEDGNNILTGGDDGRFLKISIDGQINEIYNFGTRWVDHVEAINGNIACSSGKDVYYWAKTSNQPKIFSHNSTVGGLSFDTKGRRLAVSRYGGITLWKKDYTNKWTSSNLLWKGSHNKVIFSKDGKYLISSMQENQLHCWRLKDKIDFAMSGYGSKIKSFSFTDNSKYLATSGAIDAICWPFDGDGPMGRKPVCIPYVGNKKVSFVETFPNENAVFTGLSDGSVFLSEIDKEDNTIIIRSFTEHEVSAISITNDCSNLLIGDMGGNVLWTSVWDN